MISELVNTMRENARDNTVSDSLYDIFVFLLDGNRDNVSALASASQQLLEGATEKANRLYKFLIRDEKKATEQQVSQVSGVKE